MITWFSKIIAGVVSLIVGGVMITCGIGILAVFLVCVLVIFGLPYLFMKIV